MNFFHIIKENYTFLLKDFVGITLHWQGIASFFLDIFIAFFINVVFYCLGDKIRRFFFKENKKFIFFVTIALGYITVSTGLAILGFLSLFKTEVLYSYLLIIVLIAFYPFRFFKQIKPPESLDTIKNQLSIKRNFVVWGVIIFVLLSFVRLSIPEIEEDTYHIDLPRFYLSMQTTVLEAREPLQIVPYPQLAEMTYIIPLLFGQKDAARFIHFSFYLFIVLLLFAIARKKEYSFAQFAPLLFVTAPVVMRYSHSQYTDFFLVFAFLLSIFLIEKNGSKKNTLLAGILYGAAISTKMWTLVYMPAILIYLALLNRGLKLKNNITVLVTFVVSSLLVAGIWYIRAYVITGYPLFPLFAQRVDFDTNQVLQSSVNYFGFNWMMFTYPNMIVLSPLFFLGVLFSFMHVRGLIKKVNRSAFFIFFIALLIEQLIIKVDFGRYLLAWYTFSIIIISGGVGLLFAKNTIVRYAFVGLTGIIFFYYLFTSLLALPYAFGWADQNRYLSRIMERNNASYYDFYHLFDKWITKDDFVAIYGLSYYYYADFHYIDARYIFEKDNRSFDQLQKNHVTKLLIKDGDVKSFCKRLQIKNCKLEKAKLLVHYNPTGNKVYNLYSLEW